MAELSLCAREAAACLDDAECGGCAAMAMAMAMTMAWDGGCDRGGGGGGHGRGGGHGCSEDLFLEAAPSATRCEKVGATMCRGVDANAGGGGPEEVRGGGEEGLGASQRANSCLGNRAAQALLACRVRTAGCEPGDAPCIAPEEQGVGVLTPSAGESNRNGIGRPAPRPPPAGMERAGRRRALRGDGGGGGGYGHTSVAAALTKAHREWFDPSLARRDTRKMAILPSAGICGGTLSDRFCCYAACDECGGTGCSSSGAGGENCCTDSILDSGVMCTDSGGKPPCIVHGER